MSGRIPQSFINSLIERADIVEVIEQRLPLKKSGTTFFARCPFHDDKTASLAVHPHKQIFHCFGCGKGGNVVSFVMDYDRLSYPETIELLAAKLGLDVPREGGGFQEKRQDYSKLYSLMQKVADYYHNQLRNAANRKAVDYLKNRGLTGEVAREFQLGYVADGWDNLLKQWRNDKEVQQGLLQAGMLIQKDANRFYDRFRDRIMFPIRDRRGRVIAFGGRVIDQGEPKYLNSPETALFHKKQALYGLYELLQKHRHPRQIVIVEGYMDVVALAQHGIDYAVATLGTATSRQHIQTLKKLCNHLVFCFDGDKAGRQAAWRALETTLPLVNEGIQVSFMFLPEGQDPDNLVCDQGKQGFEQQLQQAKSIADHFFDHLSAEINLQRMDGRARFIEETTKLIKQIPNGPFQQLMYERVGQLTRSDIHRMKVVSAPKADYQKQNNPRRIAIKTPPPSSLRLALGLLVQDPKLSKLINFELNFAAGVETDFLREVIEFCQQHPHINTAQLLAYWHERPEFTQLQQLAAWEHPLPPESTQAEFVGALQRLQEQAREQQIETLMAKASKGELSPQQRQQLQLLIRQCGQATIE